MADKRGRQLQDPAVVGSALSAVRHRPAGDELATTLERERRRYRRLERQLRELKREFEGRVAEQTGEIATVYEQLPVGVAIVRADERHAPRLNPRARQILGDAFPFEAQVDRALQGGDVRSAIIRLAPPGRSEIVLDVTAAPLRGRDDEVIGAVLIFDDVTDREQIERADREFVANAAHQLRTPITAIASAIAALKAGADEDPVERERFVDHLEIEADRLARIIDAMLVLSRAQRRELRVPLTLVRVRPLLERLASEARPSSGVVISYACDDTVAVIAHQGLLEEAVASALANAVEHTKTGSIALTALDVGQRVVIEVADTGPGMAPEVRERAFERFFGSTPTRRSAGLGLAIAAAAVKASHGTIELVSELGAGTQVRIVLPSAPLLRS